MIFYMKCLSYKDPDAVQRMVADMNLSVTDFIIDRSSVQKQQGSIYEQMKERLLETDRSLVIDSLSSIGKDNREIANELTWFQNNHIRLIVLDLPATVQYPEASAEIIPEVFAYLAQKEIRRVKEGQAKGIEALKLEQRSYGRKRIPYPDNWELLYERWEKGEITATDFMNEAGLKKGTFYNLVKQYRAVESQEAQKNA